MNQTPRIFIPDELYRTIFNNVPRLCVDLLFQDVPLGCLLTRRNIEPYKGLWHLPGGRIMFKETYALAAVRIAQRELGVGINVGKVIGICETMVDDLGPEDPRHSISAVLEARITSGKLKETSETLEVAYFRTMPEKMHPYHGPWLREMYLL